MPSGAFANRLFRRFFFSTGILASSYFSAASNKSWEARRPDLAVKFARMGTERLGSLRGFSTGIPTWSFFLAASNRRLEARRPNLAKKNCQTGGGKARRLDSAGMITSCCLSDYLCEGYYRENDGESLT